jgi:very-short-patch-repair endonuclease
VTTPLDLAWPRRKVALEVSPFHARGSEEKQRRDAFRRRALTAAGWRVIEAVYADIVSMEALAPVAYSIKGLLAA